MRNLALLAAACIAIGAPKPADAGIVWGGGTNASYVCNASKAQFRRWGVPAPLVRAIFGWCAAPALEAGTDDLGLSARGLRVVP
jgi:hypothetical protein